MRWTSRNPAETRALAEGLAVSLEAAGGVVGLIGPLGAGKTVFAKGLASGLGIDPGVLSSPTFVIAGEFPLGAGAQIDRLVHADFYRVEDGLELEMAGLADWLAPGTVLLAEWADRFPEELPNDRIEVQLEPSASDGAEERLLEARALGGPGSVSEQVLGRWRERCP
jgi:tRNA threonylcarbamoyladenosine biosynthesis protein TsaE